MGIYLRVYKKTTKQERGGEMKRETWIYCWLRDIKHDIQLAKFKVLWRKLNSHNETYPGGDVFPVDRVSVGQKTYGEINVYGFDRPDTTLTIGSYCSIAGNVQFWIGGEHPTKFFSTFPFAHKMGWKERLHPELASRGSVIVGDDVWIGESTIILSGVKVGKGAVIGAGSVVTKDIPPYCVWAGNKIIKKRFPDEIIDKLEKVDMKFINLESYRLVCDTELTVENVDKILEEIKRV